MLRSLRQLARFMIPYSRSFDEAGGLFPAGCHRLAGHRRDPTRVACGNAGALPGNHPRAAGGSAAERDVRSARWRCVHLAPRDVLGACRLLPRLSVPGPCGGRPVQCLPRDRRQAGTGKGAGPDFLRGENPITTSEGLVFRRHGRGIQSRRVAVERRGNRKGTPAGRRRLVDQGHRR